MLLKKVLNTDELVQRRILFRMTCKEKGKFLKLIIDINYVKIKTSSLSQQFTAFYMSTKPM